MNRHFCLYIFYVLDADYCILEGPTSRLQGTSCQWWGSLDCRGCKRRPRSLSNIKTKSLQIRAKKTPNVLDLKNMRPTFLTSKNCPHRLKKNTRRPFCRSHQRTVFTIFVGEDLQPKFRTKNILGKFAEIPAKIFLTPQNWPAPTLMPPTT